MLKLYNTLTQKIEEFKPRNPQLVTLYCCGPTVYDYSHIGNFRTYTMADFLLRSLKYFGYKMKYVMNITDVGHLVSDSDTGQDKMEKGAKREGKTAWEIAKFYTEAFLSDSRKLNLTAPDVLPRATDHVDEQIALVATLLTKGFAYEITDGIYFDSSKFADYGALTGQSRSELQAGARVEVNPQKRHPHDFALWKFSPKNQKRDMEWDSPWGKGFPGWHLECSAMSTKYLGPQLDIHAGGMDLVPIHHTNEIAQSEAASGQRPFVRWWVHGQFILVDGQRMAKSKQNFYKLADIEAKGFAPLALRYLYLTAHYRQFLNFTWEALSSAQNSLNELRAAISNFKFQISNLKRSSLSQEKIGKIEAYQKKFNQAIEDDLNLPQALAVAWEVTKSNIPSPDKYDLLMDFDDVLGLDLTKSASGIPTTLTVDQLPQEIVELYEQREALRRQKQYAQADKLRQQLEAKGYILEDTPQGVRVKKNAS